MSNPTRYPEIEVSGTPYEMGRQLGEAAREMIRGFTDVALERVNKTVKISSEHAMEVAEASFAPIEKYTPHLLEEIRGMAESSGVSSEQLMLLQVRNQLRPDEDAGCTSFSAADSNASETGPAIVGQNWDNDPELDPYTIVLTRRPTDQPAHLNITQAGLIGYIGLNDRGIGICLNTLPAPSRPLGVPHYFVVRAMYETASLNGAVEAVRRANRALPANLMMITPQGPADLEITIDDVRVLQDPKGQVVTHTNHCVHPDFVPINNDFPELIESRPRKRRIDELFAGVEHHTDVASLQEFLRDHENYPTSICRHVNDDPQFGFWTTVVSKLFKSWLSLVCKRSA